MFDFIFYVVLRIITLFILWYVVVMYGVNAIKTIFAFFITPGYMKKTDLFEHRLLGASWNILPISILVPSCDEEATVVESVKSILNINYANYEVVVINDGSSDKTLAAVVEAFNLHKIIYPVRERLATRRVRGIYYNPDLPRLRVIDKERGGKSDALNAGVNLSRYPYIVSMGADSFLDPDALFPIAMAFMQNKYTVAVAGTNRVANGCHIENGKIINQGLPKKVWPLFQTIEYFRTFLCGRIGWNVFNSLLIISGALGGFQKEAVLAVGGFSAGVMGEDMDLVIKLHRYMHSRKYKYRVSFLPDAICWKQAPSNLKTLCRQRRRWQIGLMDVLGRNRSLFMNPAYGLLGLLAAPYYFLFEVISALIELLGYVLIPLAWYFGFISLDSLVLFFTASVFFGAVSSIGSLAVEESTTTKYISVRELVLLCFLCIAENLFFRQLTLLFRFAGIFTYRKYKRNRELMKHKKNREN